MAESGLPESLKTHVLFVSTSKHCQKRRYVKLLHAAALSRLKSKAGLMGSETDALKF